MIQEDLYTGKVTIRQIRGSYHPEFDMKKAWETIKALGGPGIIEDKNYLLCPSSAFWTALLTWIRGSVDIMTHSLLNQSLEEYTRKYPLTMLIQDI